MGQFFENKRILVTGGTGSIGSVIVKKLLEYNPQVVRIFSSDEAQQFELQQELQHHRNVRFLLGDVRERERLRRAVEGINLIFHAAALKHVPLCEYNPFEAVKTNILGTQNLIEAALDEGVDKLLTISTDKAINPVNVMGATKLLAERLTISANYYKGKRKTVFACVRFGNVLDSRGSVVPLFRSQIESGGPVTVTDPRMTRFIMTIPRATELVLKAAEKAQGGEIFILKMPVITIGDLAQVMIEELAPQYGHSPKKIKVEIRGKRAGEKSHEELMTQDEALNAYEVEDMFIVLPQIAFQDISYADYPARKVSVKHYSTQDLPPLPKTKIRKLLKELEDFSRQAKNHQG